VTVQKHQAPAPLEFFERQIGCRIEVGGYMDCRVTGDSVSFVIAMACEAVMAAHNAGLLEGKEVHSINVELSYWHLTEDCKDLTIKAGECGVPEKGQSFEAGLNQTVEQVKAEFLKALALAQITLTGLSGKLQEDE